MSIKSESELQRAYKCLEEFDPNQAKQELSSALVNDLSNKEIMFCLKISGFWITRINLISEKSDLFEQGEFLLNSWKEFIRLLKNEDDSHEQCIYSIRKGIFTYMLDIYQRLLAQNNSSQKGMIFEKIGFCYKELGDFETALRFLSDANSAIPENAEILAEMADCYALCGQEKMAKVLFREAFFINPKNIDIELLESEIFCLLFAEVNRKFPDTEIAVEWLPVEGVLLGVFNVKRELRSIEVGKLKQSIFSLENEFRNDASQANVLKPRLINKYFWLIDHYIATREDKSKVNENLLKIKLLDQDIYNRYTI